MNESRKRLFKTNSTRIMKGCPFNSFGPCREGECMFSLNEEDARKALSLLDPAFRAAPLFMEDKCVIWLTWLAAHETFDAQSETVDFVEAREGYDQAAYHPMKLLLTVLSSIEQRLESLEKELKKS